MLYNAVLVSAEQQSESALHMPSFLGCFPLRPHRALRRVPCLTHRFALVTCFTRSIGSVSTPVRPPSSDHPPAFPLPRDPHICRVALWFLSFWFVSPHRTPPPAPALVSAVSGLLPRGAPSAHAMSSVTGAVTGAPSLLCRRFPWGPSRLSVAGRPQAAASFPGQEFRIPWCSCVSSR